MLQISFHQRGKISSLQKLHTYKAIHRSTVSLCPLGCDPISTISLSEVIHSGRISLTFSFITDNCPALKGNSDTLAVVIRCICHMFRRWTHVDAIHFSLDYVVHQENSADLQVWEGVALSSGDQGQLQASLCFLM